LQTLAVARRALLTLALALLACGTASAAPAPSWKLLDPIPTRGDAENFLSTVTRQVVANNYAAAWQSLYPPHQVVAPLEEYVACELKSPIPGHLDRITVVRSWWAAVKVAGQPKRVRGVRVRFFLRIVDPAGGGAVALHTTFAAVWIGWRWAWMLPQERYDMYVAKSC
jgi:hypothetical protein